MNDRLKSLNRRLLESVKAGEQTASIIERATKAAFQLGLSENDYRSLLDCIADRKRKNEELHRPSQEEDYYEEVELTDG